MVVSAIASTPQFRKSRPHDRPISRELLASTDFRTAMIWCLVNRSLRIAISFISRMSMPEDI